MHIDDDVGVDIVFKSLSPPLSKAIEKYIYHLLRYLDNFFLAVDWQAWNSLSSTEEATRCRLTIGTCRLQPSLDFRLCQYDPRTNGLRGWLLFNSSNCLAIACLVFELLWTFSSFVRRYPSWQQQNFNAGYRSWLKKRCRSRCKSKSCPAY